MFNKYLKRDTLNSSFSKLFAEGKLLSGENVYEKAKREMRLSEKILAEIPGFRGYKEKELRRESDKLVRDAIFQRLREARNDLREVFQMFSDQKFHEVMVRMDRLIMRFDRVTQKVNHAAYGYSGFFNIVKIDEAKLDRMLAFDSGLVNYASVLVDKSKALKKDVVDNKFEAVAEKIKDIEETLSSLESTFDARKEVILEG